MTTSPGGGGGGKKSPPQAPPIKMNPAPNSDTGIIQTTSVSNLASDIIRNFKFHVKAYPPTATGYTPYDMYFMTIQGLAVQTDVIMYREGGLNTYTQKLPGQADFAPIVLTQGIQIGRKNNLSWQQQIFVLMQGQGNLPQGTDFRYIVDIEIIGHPATNGKAVIPAIFRLYNCWPTAETWSDLDAGADALFISQLSLAYEGFDYKIADNVGRSVTYP